MFFWLKQSTQKSPPVAREHIMQWRDEEIPRYPPFMKGLPVVHPTKLLETQSELLERITNTAIATPEIIKQHYIPIINRFASFVHLLPASQSHHHRGAGGLLRHSLEVGLWALQSADKVLLDVGKVKTPFQRREMEPRWQLTVFVAALYHDAGKPVTDLIVTNKDRTTIWKPIKEDLYAWATKNDINAYFLDWREGRARQHTAMSNLVAARLIGAGTLEWIEEGGLELIIWLVESLSSNPGPTNPIHDLVIKADQTSVEHDLKTLGVAMAGYDLGVPVERHLTDIMRRFVKESVWLVNEPGARLWKIGGNTYLVWPAAGEEIVRQVLEDKIPGIPRTPDGILDMLVERQLAFVREGASPEDRLWKIAPAVLAEKIPDIKLSAIRLRDEALVSSTPILQVEGRIINDDEPVQQSVSTAPQQTAWQQENERITEGAERPQVVEQQDQKNSTPPKVVRAEATAITAERTASDSNIKVSSPAAVETAATTSSAEDSSNMIALFGPVGEVLKAIAQDLRSGDKQWGVDAVVDKERQVVLKWPDAFNGYGLTAKTILDELSAKQWLWVDPMAPLKRVLDMKIGSVQAKVIRLERDISEAFISIAEQTHTPENQQIGALKSSDNGDAVMPEPQREDIRSESTARLSKRDHNQSPVNASPSDKPTEAGQNSQMATTSHPSLDQIINILGSLPSVQTEDGWCKVTKYEAMAALKAKGIRLTHSALGKIGEQNPDKLIVSGVIRFRA